MYTSYEILAIQRLSITNILIIIALLSTLELGVYQLIKKQGKILISKGLSVRQIFLLIFTIDALVDFSAACFSLVVFSLVITAMKLPLTTIVSLLETYGLFYIVIVLSKIITLLVFTKKQLSDNKDKLKHSKRIPIPIQKSTISLFFVFVVILIQTYSILDPLFYFKLLNKNTTISPKQIRITIDIISLILTLFIIINYFRNETFRVHKKTEKSHLSVKKLLSRLFSKEIKVFKAQQLIIICFYSLLFYLIIFKTVDEQYIGLNENSNSWDAFFYSYHESLSYKKVVNLTQSIPQIKEICPSYGSWGHVIYNSSVYSTGVKIINTTSYLSKDLGWNHFIGMKTYKINNSLLREVKGKSIIINRFLAERSSLKEGDKISLELEIDVSDYNVYEYGYKNIVVDDLTIIGIVDTISTTSEYSYNRIIMDISLLPDIFEKANIEPKIDSFWVDFFFSENATEGKRKIELEYYISLILSELDCSRSNVIIYTGSVDQMEILHSKNIAEKFFIYVEIIICSLFIPTTILILSQSTVERLVPNLIKIGARGYSDKNIRKGFTKKVNKSLINSILLGLFLGLIVGTIHTKNKLPIVYLAQNVTKIYAKTGFYFVLCALGGLLSTLFIIHFSSKKIRTIIIEKRRLIIKNEAHRN